GVVAMMPRAVGVVVTPRMPGAVGTLVRRPARVLRSSCRAMRPGLAVGRPATRVLAPGTTARGAATRSSGLGHACLRAAQDGQGQANGDLQGGLHRSTPVGSGMKVVVPPLSPKKARPTRQQKRFISRRQTVAAPSAARYHKEDTRCPFSCLHRRT